ncbi:unnamed protein product [Darwinula stevensoni]|uniref:Uncharacterized protein n=1 Tax=Darwinula stevensoni TaxID=69355 RepID=A0A7R9FQL5_9CRUS|nr:unnamed protein product [Darwinula stevensoni]CAG0899659.1 unnamed protein product [Darwinula stevensoni]
MEVAADGDETLGIFEVGFSSIARFPSPLIGPAKPRGQSPTFVGRRDSSTEDEWKLFLDRFGSHRDARDSALMNFFQRYPRANDVGYPHGFACSRLNTRNDFP